MHEDFQHRLVVVADAAQAKIFRFRANRLPLEPVDELQHGASRLKNRELVTGGRGATHASHGHGVDQTEGSRQAHEHEADRFAVELAGWLRDARTRRGVDDLVLVSAPRFLGKLREHLDTPTSRCVTRSINKDLVTHPTDSIERALQMDVVH